MSCTPLSTSAEAGTSIRFAFAPLPSQRTLWSISTAVEIFRTAPLGVTVWRTTRLGWYEAFSVWRYRRLDPAAARAVGCGRFDAVPGVPPAVGPPLDSSVVWDVRT